jgi:serine/threonine protein kinase
VTSAPWLSDGVVAHLRHVAGGRVDLGRRYELLEEIGRGGMGVVHRALDLELQRDVAVKILHDSASADVETRLLREARIMGRLEHPGLVPIYDVGRTDDGRVFYVMRLVRGESLDARLARGVAPDECIRIVDRLCDTVAFAHAHGVVHRDLKPANIMLGPFGDVLVLDWGVARADDRDPTPVVGTHGFMAPEQARGQSAQADERADIYGIGAVLDTCAPQPRPRTLHAVIRRCLEERPVDRYQTVHALATDLRRLVAGHAVSAYREGPIERLGRVAVRYRVPIALVAAYLVLRVLLLLAGGV